MGRTKKRTNTRSRKTRRHRGGFGQEQPAVPQPVVPPPASTSLFQPSTQIQPVKPCGWWGALFGCPKPTVGGRRKKYKRSVSFQR